MILRCCYAIYDIAIATLPLIRFLRYAAPFYMLYYYCHYADIERYKRADFITFVADTVLLP